MTVTRSVQTLPSMERLSERANGPSRGEHGGPVTRARVLFGHVRAWMIVIPVDAIWLMTPVLWTPEQFKAIASMTVLSLLLIVERGRYRARLHISVLEELPNLLGNLLTAAAVIATVIALRHDQDLVTIFLQNAAISIGLVVAGRGLTTQLIIWSRRRRVAAHRTVIIGTGALAEELARILDCL